MNLIDWIFNGLLAATLVFLAGRILWVSNLFHAVVLFIAFGLLMAMAWVRLSAPDVALAEAGIGAALTGVLLVDALHNLSWKPVLNVRQRINLLQKHSASASWPTRILGILVAGCLVLLLLKTARDLPETGPGLIHEVTNALPDAGVTQPVTAVLLNFRSFDTLLELTILFLAIIGILCVRGTRSLSRLPLPARGDLVVEWLLKLLLPLLAMVAIYLLWLGSFDAGGAFQAGVIISAGAVLLWLTGRNVLEHMPVLLRKSLLLCGLFMLCAVGVLLLFSGRSFLEYPPEWAPSLILLLELASAISIGAALAGLFLGFHSPGQDPAFLEGKE